MIRIRHAAAVALTIGASSVCAAQTSLPLTDDAFVNGNLPDAEFGLGDDPLVVHTWGPKHLLVRFAASGLPPDVSSASLSLLLTELAAAGTIDVYAVTGEWSQDTVTYNLLPSTEPEPFTSVAVSPDDVGADVTVDVGDAVARWADGSLPPEGFLLAARDPVRALFASQETGWAPALEVAAGRGPGQPEVLDFSSLPVVIDESGMYVLDRNWRLGSDFGVSEPIMRIEANDVDVDFRGFTRASRHNGQGVSISGRAVTLRNGTLAPVLDGTPILGTGLRTRIEDMDVYLSSGAQLGDRVVVRDSRLRGQVGIEVGRLATIEHNDFECEILCLRVNGSGAEIRGNRIDTFEGDVVIITGDDAVVADNLFQHRFSLSIYTSLVLNGNNNRAVGNTFILGPNTHTLIGVHGTRNVVDHNVASRGEDQGVAANRGIVFTVDGNYYGDNRLHATVPVDLGGTVQTDWGGNVGY